MTSPDINIDQLFSTRGLIHKLNQVSRAILNTWCALRGTIRGGFVLNLACCHAFTLHVAIDCPTRACRKVQLTQARPAKGELCADAVL